MTPACPVAPDGAPSSEIMAMSCSSLPDMLTEHQSSKLSTGQQSSYSLHAKTTHVPSGALKQRGAGAQQKRNSWMRSSVVRRAATVVDEEVEALCEKSPFLNSCLATSGDDGKDGIALFHRLEVHLGKALGRGGFAEVYTVAGLDVDDDDDDDPRAMRRRECQQKLTNSDGRPAFAIKLLRKKLLSNTREFQHAAIDMAVESKYLAALSHPNIIKVRGLTAGGTGAFRTGKHDDFFIIMDHLQETLEHRMTRWQQRKEMGNSSPKQYFPRTVGYAQQIADALAFLHDKSIVYRDLKPQNLGFRERDVIQLFDFGLCRELPKPKGQGHRAENLEDEETFHMSGVGTQRYMAPEIINTRRYNLKADVYSWSMVVLEMMTWKKPFWEYTPEEHQKYVAGLGERPKLGVGIREHDQVPQQLQDCLKHPQSVNVEDWPLGLADLLQESWTQDVLTRLTMQSVLEHIGTIVAYVGGFEPQTTDPANSSGSQDNALGNEETEVVLEFPSHFSPRHQLSASSRHRHDQESRQQQLVQISPDDSNAWFGDRQSDASTSYQELTMTSASTTLHDSNSTT